MIFLKKFIYILLILTLLKSYAINNVFTNEVDEAKQGKIGHVNVFNSDPYGKD